jgi:hypothetical protein
MSGGIYRKLGYKAKYLPLCTKKLVYGGDYYDLATFYNEFTGGLNHYGIVQHIIRMPLSDR